MMSKRRPQGQTHMISEFFTFVLFAMFLLLSLLIVVIGADGYRKVVDTGESVGAVRTSMGYVAGKVRSNTGAENVELRQYGDLQTLVLTDVIDGITYETVIYFQDGALYETQINADEMSFDPEYGTRLTEIQSFAMSMPEDGMLRLDAQAADGRAQTLHLVLPKTQEETP